MKSTTLTSGPWDGVYNASDASDAYKKKLYAASNMYRPKGETGWAMRPPFFVTKAAGTLGTAGSRFGDALHEFVMQDGSFQRIVIVGGKVYRWDGGTTYTDVTPVSVTITSGLPRVYCCTFNDNLIVSDGVHKPWFVPASGITATPLVATEIEIDSSSSSWAAFGQPVVYDARLFFIVGTQSGVSGWRSSIVWSEVGDPTTGYEQTNFANFWQLYQTDAHPLNALAATEQSLVVLRSRSILNITGKTTADFATNATRESVDGIGTDSPDSVMVLNGYVWFQDVNGHQFRYAPGGKPEPLWAQMADTCNAAIPTKYAQQCTICYHADFDLVLTTAYGGTRSLGAFKGAQLIHTWDATTGVYRGTWDIDGLKTIHCLGVMRYSSTATTYAIVALGESVTATNLGYTLSTSGQMWRQYTLREMDGTISWADPSGPSASVTTHHLGRNEDAVWSFDTLRVRAVTSAANAAGRTLPCTYYTTRGSSTPTAAVLSQPPSQPINPTLTGYQGEGRAVWGLGPNAKAVRYLQAVVSVPSTAQTQQPFTPIAIEVTGKLSPASPATP